MNKQTFVGWIGLFCLACHLNAQEAEWLTDLPTALARAKAENKTVLLDFTGSDWCGWCIRLKREVFDQPEFVTYAQSKLVLVEVDFPRQKPQTAELQAANKALSEQYGITGYPTIFLVDADGKKLGRSGYREGGASKYVAHLERVLNPPPPVAPAPNPVEPPATVVPIKPVSATLQPPPPPIRYTKLTLKGIVGSKKRRCALINNKTLVAGEKIKMTLGDKQVEIICQEIRENSVVILVEGETKPTELRLSPQ